MATEALKVTGNLTIVHTDASGDVIETRNINNLIVTTGRNFIAGRLIGTPVAMSHMALGTGTAATALTDTALASEATSGVRPTVTATQGTGSNQNQITYVASFGAGVGTGAITEAGILNAASAGTMLARTTFAPINKGSADSVTITWTITVQ